MAKKKMTLEEKLEDAIVKDVPYEVPENWVWSRLDNISTLVTGNTPSKKKVEYYGENVPFIKPNDLDQGRKLHYSTEMLSSLGVEKARVLPKGSTAVCCIGSIGKSAYLEIEGATNQQINSIIPNKINNLYVYYYVLSDYFQRELINNSSATTISIINKSKMGQLFIPLPPLKEQQRIVHRIESLFEKLDKSKELVEEARNGFEKRKQSLLEKTFRGELTKEWRKNNELTDEYKRYILKDLLRPMTNKKPDLSQSYFRYIDIDAIDNKKQVVEEPKILKTIKAPSRAKREVLEGDILFSTVRPYLKNIAYITQDLEDCIASTGFYVCRCREKLDSKFLYRLLCSEKVLNYYTSIMKGDNSPSIRKGEFEGLEIEVPSIEEQKEIVHILDNLLGDESKIEELTKLEEQIELIKKSILAKAFRGKLGTNCEEDESALELLKEVLSKDL